jgi:hypothetical protein
VECDIDVCVRKATIQSCNKARADLCFDRFQKLIELIPSLGGREIGK